MSKHKRFRPGSIRDYPLESRSSKVDVSQFARPAKGDRFADFLETIPRILAGQDLRDLSVAVRRARDSGKALIWGFGGHVVKVGLAPILIDLMERGFVSALATNGAGLIHDFEIAYCGNTSEDVEAELGSGAFGMARETGEFLNQAVKRGADAGQGIGEAVGAALQEIPLRHPECSLLVQAWRLNRPLSVHVAIGTDIIHNHPSFSGEAAGKCSQIDFEIFTEQVSRLHGGGVYLNLGSAVLLPEVFLKAVSLVRNSGQELEGFYTANLDFIQHYRPTQNVVRRPVAGTGRGFALTGHHEILLPLLAATLVD